MKQSDSSLKKAEEKFQSAAQQFHSTMEPYLDKMETDEGKVSMVMISTIAIAVFKGAESPAALARTIELAAAKTSIPKVALEALSRFTTAMVNVLEIRHQNNSPRSNAG